MPDGLAEINQKPYCQVEIDQTRDGLVEINQKPYCQVDIDQKPYSLVEIDRLALLSSVTPPPLNIGQMQICREQLPLQYGWRPPGGGSTNFDVIFK